MDHLTTSNTGVRVDARLVAGSTGTIHLVLIDRTTMRPVNFAGWSGDVTFKDGPTTVLILSTANGGLLLDGSGNIETLAFAAAAPWKHAEYSVRLTDPNGTTIYPFYGTVDLVTPAQLRGPTDSYGYYTAGEL